MRTLKKERFRLHLFSFFAETKGIIEAWIQVENTERPHQELGYVYPVEYRYEHAA